MKRFSMIRHLTAGVLMILTVTLASCGGGGYGGGGGSGGLAPAAFTLSAPSDLATGVTTTPTLIWTASLYASDYRVQIDTIITFPAPIVNTIVSAPSVSFTVPGSTLAPATPYYWRVIAENIYGQAVAGPRSFTP